MKTAKRQLTKVLEGNVTVQKILDQEELKDIADKIVSEDIDNIILIYRDVKEKSVCWVTTIKQWATIFGSLEMIHELMLEDWEIQRYSDEEE